MHKKVELAIQYIAKRDHYSQVLKYAHRIKSEFIWQMKSELDWIASSEDAISYLINLALVSKNTGSLPEAGGLFNQNYWFVLVLNELTLYIESLKSQSLTEAGGG
nr:hypothetical protein LKV13_04515 [Borrelia sp. BU AG58]